MILRLLGTAALTLALLTDAAAQSTPAKRRNAKADSDRNIKTGQTMLPGMGAVTPADLSDESRAAAPDKRRANADAKPVSPYDVATPPAGPPASGPGAVPSVTPERPKAAQNTLNVHAAPGQPVNVQDGPVGPYDGPAAEERKEERKEERQKGKTRETNTLRPAR